MGEMERTILVVDDDPKNHKIVAGILEDDYLLASAFSGEECLTAVADCKPQLILLDIMMADLDGYEVCRRLKGNPETRDIPVVFVSAKGSLEERLEGYEVGAEDYFVKPFDHEELAVKVRRLLSHRESLESLRQRAAQASDVAMKAMTNTSELGTIIGFLQASFSLRSYQELADRLLETMSGYQLNCSVQIDDGHEVLNASSEGWVSPLESQVLSQARSKGRIFDYKANTVVNFDHIALLIRDMPLDDPHQYGTIKDNVCILLEGAEARIKAMVAEAQVEKQSGNLQQVITHALAATERTNETYRQLRLKQAAIVEDLTEGIEELIPRMGLTEAHETELLGVTQACVNQTHALFNEGLREDERFSALLRELQSVSQRHGVASAGFARLLDKLGQ